MCTHWLIASLSLWSPSLSLPHNYAGITITQSHNQTLSHAITCIIIRKSNTHNHTQSHTTTHTTTHLRHSLLRKFCNFSYEGSVLHCLYTLSYFLCHVIVIGWLLNGTKDLIQFIWNYCVIMILWCCYAIMLYASWNVMRMLLLCFLFVKMLWECCYYVIISFLSYCLYYIVSCYKIEEIVFVCNYLLINWGSMRGGEMSNLIRSNDDTRRIDINNEKLKRK